MLPLSQWNDIYILIKVNDYLFYIVAQMYDDKKSNSLCLVDTNFIAHIFKMLYL